MSHALSNDTKVAGDPGRLPSAPQRLSDGSVTGISTTAGRPGMERAGVGNQAALRRLGRPNDNAAPAATPRHCAACAQAQAQTRPAKQDELDGHPAPAIVHSVLHEPGQPLATPLRAFFEPRFSRNLGDVRVHSDARAAESARAVDAFAYTVGQHVAMAADHYPPRTPFGMSLLAHELVHTLQQGGGPERAPTELRIGDPTDGAEREAHAGSTAVMRQRTLPWVARYPVRLSRWQITGSTATVDSEQDRLGLLPDKLKSGTGNWICIQPIAMRTATMATPPADFQTHYERYLQIGDTFDLSNLTATGGGNSLRLSLLLDPEVNAVLSSKEFYPGMRVVAADPLADIAKQSGEGKTPLSELIMFGHSGGHDLYGDAGKMTPKDLKSDEPAPTFDRAHIGKLPHRCWFTTDAQARAIGCYSDTFGDEFSTTFLRGGGKTAISSTLRNVILPYAPNYKEGEPSKAGEPKYMKALAFSSDVGDTPAEVGPFGDAASFHASKYWQKTKGGL